MRRKSAWRSRGLRKKLRKSYPLLGARPSRLGPARAASRCLAGALGARVGAHVCSSTEARQHGAG
eukprot:3232736-Pyramimonas_sp.AAC.1